MRDDQPLDAGSLRGAQDQERLVAVDVPGREREVVLGDDGDHLVRLGHERAVARHAHERAALVVVAHLVLGVVRRHPDDPA